MKHVFYTVQSVGVFRETIGLDYLLLLRLLFLSETQTEERAILGRHLYACTFFQSIYKQQGNALVGTCSCIDQNFG